MPAKQLRVLAACEFSGRVRDAFAARGWEAWSADIRPSETPVLGTYTPDGPVVTSEGEREGSGYHYQGDVRDLFSYDHPVNRGHYEYRVQCTEDGAFYPWDLVIAFPPCTHLSLAGARYWKAKQADGRQQAAAGFFTEMVNAPGKRVAVENPVGYMGKAYRKPDQVVQPWWFGDPLRKATCLWLQNLPLLYADNTVIPTGRVATGGGSYRVDTREGRGNPQAHEDGEGRARRDIVRSRTLPDFARAMADQWGPWIEAREGAS